MTAAARTVSGSVQSIAAISEENSAAAEEVSAATEEMSAQAEEVVASAASLAQMADELDEVVARFVLEAGRRARRPGKRLRAATHGTESGCDRPGAAAPGPPERRILAARAGTARAANISGRARHRLASPAAEDQLARSEQEQVR